MALKACHECGKEYSSEAKACIHCGASNADHVKASSGCLKAVGMIVMVVVGFFVVMALVSVDKSTPEERDEKYRARVAIDACHKSKDDELKDLSTRRFVRDVCDKMEADFRAKYGVDP